MTDYQSTSFPRPILMRIFQVVNNFIGNIIY